MREGLIDRTNMATSVLLMPLAPLGVWLGIFLARRIEARWFYWIAYTAKVPIVCGYLDYGRKRAGLGFYFVPTGDVRSDMERIRGFYADKRGKFPDNESTIALKEETEEARASE